METLQWIKRIIEKQFYFFILWYKDKLSVLSIRLTFLINIIVIPWVPQYLTSYKQVWNTAHLLLNCKQTFKET